MNKNLFGPKLRMARLSAGLSQRELGEITGIARVAISAYENCYYWNHNGPTLDTVIKLAEALHVSIDWFVTFSDENGAYV